MQRLIAAAILALLAFSPANAQQAIVVNTCGTQNLSLSPVTPYALFQDKTGTLCTTAGSGGGGGAVTNAGTFAVQNTAATPAGTNVIGHVIVDTAPTTAVTIASLPSGAVTNAGTFAVQSTPVASAVLMGKVGIDQTTPGTTNLVALGANQSVNVAQFGGVSTATGQVAVSVAPVTATNTAMVVDLRPDSPGIIALGAATVANSLSTLMTTQYPTNSVTTTPAPITGNAAGTTAAVVGTLSAAASVTTFICGFNVQAIGGTATVGPITIAGLVGSSQVYQTDVNSATVGKTVASATFNPCIPASAVNTAITITTTANGTATAVDVNSWGYRL